jgi:hypothetical protein
VDHRTFSTVCRSGSRQHPAEVDAYAISTWAQRRRPSFVASPRTPPYLMFETKPLRILDVRFGPTLTAEHLAAVA